ncbi:MAG: LapA family protein [Cyanophyceae cyanobacterium]
MFVIAIRLLMALAIAYLFGLLVAWLVSFFNGSDDDGWHDGGDQPTPPLPPGSGEKPQSEKRLVEVDESYYIEEFDLSRK